jgi:hypothetical protein
MNQRELYRQISRATGDSIQTISGMGFVLEPSPGPEPEPQVIDWDEHDAASRLRFVPQRRRRHAAAVA